MVRIVIDGKPVGKGRPRVARGRAYTPDKTAAYEAYAQFCFNTQCKGTEPLLGALKATVFAYYYIPKNTPKKTKELMLEGKIRPTVTPDIDNVLKIVLDSLLKLAYYDDNQIVEVVSYKYYSETPRVEVEIEEI